MRPRARLVWLFALAFVGVTAIALRQPTGEPDVPRLAYVTTAHQLGVVGYRDPVGIISPDGSRIAFVEGRRVFSEPIGGGARAELAIAGGQIRHLAWLGDSLIYEDGAAAHRWRLVRQDRGASVLFESRTEFRDGTGATVRINDLRQVAGSPDGRAIAAIAAGPSGAELWRIAIDASQAQRTPLPGRTSFPSWTAKGEIGCVVGQNGRGRISSPCGQPGGHLDPDVDVIGPLAFSPDDRTVYFASPNASGSVDLWTADRASGRARKLSAFSRDSYAPSVARDGTVLFKSQTYRTSVAELDLASGMLRELTAFQAETPSYQPDGRRIAVTFGTWRRVIDDANYPDIAQDIGVIAAGPGAAAQREPLEIVARSDSEDQAMAWSPNAKWIAYHSHKDQSDDVWLRAADGSSDRRISFLGRGAEVGWPRWSPDGRTVLFDGASPRTHRSVAFIVGIDQDSGNVTSDVTEVAVSGVQGEIAHAEWLPDSHTVVAVAKEAPGRHVLFTVPAAGGAARIVHRVATEHDFSGLGVSPDGRHLAFVAPAPDGFFQIFRIPVSGGSSEQVTFDRSHKTQPAWSPDGGRIAFTIWDYIAQFWTIRP